MPQPAGREAQANATGRRTPCLRAANAAASGLHAGRDRPARRGARRPGVPSPLALIPLLFSLSALAAPAAPDALGCQAALERGRDQTRSLQRQAPRLEVLLLGEIHTSAADHLWQRQTLESLAGLRPLSLGLEMIPAARQPILDRYASGALSEEAFLRQVGWSEVWGHDPDLYLPLLRWARRERVPLLALNAEPELVRRVRRQGLAAIPPGEREGISTPAPASPAYRQRLMASWIGHRSFAPAPAAPGVSRPGGGMPRTEAGSDGGGRGTAAGERKAGEGEAGPGGMPALSSAQASDLQRFIESQLLRDRAMAERIAAARRHDPERLVVALMGHGHLENGDGVPLQLRALGLERQLSLQRPPLPGGCEPAPPRARLGAYLESDPSGVWVRRVAPGSAAEAAGLRPGDRILELNGTAVDRAGQVIRGVRLQPDDVPLRLLIERDGRRLRLQLRLPPSSDPRLAARDNGVPVATAAGMPTRTWPRLLLPL